MITMAEILSKITYMIQNQGTVMWLQIYDILNAFTKDYKNSYDMKIFIMLYFVLLFKNI